MKKCFILLFAILLLICSCENKNETCILRVNVKDPNTRTVAPDKSQSAISRYVLKGVFAGRPIIEQSQTSTFTVSIEQRGLWSMYVEAYAKDGKLVAKSDSQSIEILPYKDVEATFQLKPIFDGNGTFNFKLGIPKDVTTMDKILCSLSSEEGTLTEVKYEFDFKTDATIDGDYSIFTKTLNLPAGSYNLKVETTNVFGDVYGIPINESVVILTDQTTDYEHIWDMAYFPVESASINSDSEYFPGYLYISKSSDDVNVYCSFDNGDPIDITDKIQNNYVVLADAKYSNLRVVAVSDLSKWTRGNSNIELKTLGPAGGVVFYDCDADNEYGNKDGLTSTECKWRYLEAAPENLSKRYIFGYYYTSSSSYEAVTSSALGKGKENTENLVKQMGTQARTSDSSSSKYTELYAARMASLYSYNDFNDWFLPSKDELGKMYLVKNHIGSLPTDYYYWSSSEDSNYFAWYQSFDNGYQDSNYRKYDYSVRPIRAF